MALDEVNARGIVLLGCGKMGSAMLEGWIARGLAPGAVWVIEPDPSDWLQGAGVHLNGGLPDAPAVALVAVKPQVVDAALGTLAPYAGGGTVVVSVAAGVTLGRFAAVLGSETPVIRTIPNTPAAIGRGITALIGNAPVTEAQMATAEALLGAVGETVRLQDEAQMDAVTAVSGSGPAYLFHMIEALAEAGVAQGLPRDMALRLARATVAGAGALAEATGTDPATLRANVTSPQGTTAAALDVLMDAERGLAPLMARAVAAATDRSRELGR